MSQPRPRFLALGAGNGHGYTTRPLRELPTTGDDEERRIEVERVREATSLRDEPECIGPAIVDGYAEIAQFQHSLRHAREVEEARTRRPDLEPEKRLQDITRRAKHAHVNLTRECMIMGAEITRARTGGRNVPGRILRRMENVEALLDGIA